MEIFEDIYENVIKRLESELPVSLTYHNADHTKYVLDRAHFLANREHLSNREILLVKTAALYHDTGFLVQRKDHEALSCKIAFNELQGSDFTSVELAEICAMITATRIPQSPKTLPEKIVADADLFYLGTIDYEYFSGNLYSEMKHFDPELTEKAWLKIQQNFLSRHRYHTDYCKSVLEPLKERNLNSL